MRTQKPTVDGYVVFVLPRGRYTTLIRLIHTADVHLDRCYSSARFPAAFANRRRQTLRDAFLSIVARAGEWPADALLIAGDLFEYDRVSRDTIALLRRAFESVPHVPVFIAPGNHDPYLPDSPYASHRWPKNVFIFQRPTWSAHALERVAITVHGFGFDGPNVSTNPFGSLSVPNDGRVHVAVAHGSEMGSLPSGKTAYAPFDAMATTPEALRYLALGHYHGAKRIAVKGACCVQYCGSPVGHDFGETGLHGFVEIEIDGEETRVREVPASNTLFSVHELDCGGMESSQQIVEAVRAIAHSHSGSHIARVTLRGGVPQELRMDLHGLQDAVRDAFEYIEVIDHLEIEDDFASLAADQTSLGAFIAEMNMQISDATEERRRTMLLRARELGVAAYRGRTTPLRVAAGE